MRSQRKKALESAAKHNSKAKTTDHRWKGESVIKVSVPEELRVLTRLPLGQGQAGTHASQRSPIGGLAEARSCDIAGNEIQHHETDFVRRFRHEGEDCPRCDGSGLRPRRHCAGCGVPAGRPSQGGKALSPKRGTKTAKELRSLPLYCMDCTPRFFRADLALFAEGGS